MRIKKEILRLQERQRMFLQLESDKKIQKIFVQDVEKNESD